jgi:hypothetical protein
LTERAFRFSIIVTTLSPPDIRAIDEQKHFVGFESLGAVKRAFRERATRTGGDERAIADYTRLMRGRYEARRVERSRR